MNREFTIFRVLKEIMDSVVGLVMLLLLLLGALLTFYIVGFLDKELVVVWLTLILIPISVFRFMVLVVKYLKNKHKN